MVETPHETEQFWGKKDHLRSTIKIEPSTRSVVIVYGDKYGSYVINGVVKYRNDKYSGTLKTFTDFRRSSPYICLTVDPSIHQYLIFDLRIKGGKVKSISQVPTPCNRFSKEKEKELTEEQKKNEKKKGFLEQLNDLVKSIGLILVILLVIAALVVAFMIWKGVL